MSGHDLNAVTIALAPRYQLERELASGGMATVYLAFEPKHDRRVAIKVFRPEIPTTLGLARFLREIRLTASLSHPHILPLLDSGQIDDFTYYVMPYVKGESLRERLARGNQLPIDDVVRLTSEVASALDTAHKSGIVHRDIKPGNILLEEGHARVADFGLGRAVEELGGEVTASGVALGTPLYMSPEQASGAADVDLRSDIYSLACVVYEMLAGEPPFTGPTPQVVITKKLSLTPPALATYRDGLSPQVDLVVRKALSRSRADRFPTATAFAEALRKALLAPARRRPARLFGPAAVLFLAVLGSIGIWQIASRTPRGLDANRVVVFPFADSQGGTQEGLAAAFMILNSLDQASPIRPVEGWTWLDEAQRSDVSQLSAAEGRAIALDRGARYFIDGRVLAAGDSMIVAVSVHDVADDEIVSRATASEPVATASVPRLALRALVSSLPSWLDPDGEVDFSALADRNAGAVVTWMHGERSYRFGRFAEALAQYQAALAQDPLLARAAVKGAQVATWLRQEDAASSLIHAASAGLVTLPEHHAAFAHGLEQYLAGAADSAAAQFRKAIGLRPDWSEAWMALGEVYLHLLPAEPEADSLAMASFAQAIAHDPSFSPALIHLTELMLARGDYQAAAPLIDRIESSEPDASHRSRVLLMAECVQHGGDAVDWTRAVRQSPLEVLNGAKILSGGGRNFPCAEAGFRSLLARDSLSNEARYGAFLGLEALLIATARDDEAARLIDEMIPWAGSGVRRLFLLHEIAGADFGAASDQTQAYYAGEYGPALKGASISTLWALGAWFHHRGDVSGLNRTELAIRALEPSAATDRVLALVTARQQLMRGDTAAALQVLSATRPDKPHGTLIWDEQETLAAERLLEAEVLVKTGRFQDAIRAAATFDHPEPITYLAFLPASLEIRREAAERLGDRAQAEHFAARLDALRRTSSTQ